MKYSDFLLAGLFCFMFSICLQSQHLYCKHPTDDGDGERLNCDPVYTEGDKTFVDHSFSIFLPRVLLENHDFIITIDGGYQILNEPVASINLSECSSANSSIYYQELECSQSYDILEFQANLQIQISNNICSSPSFGNLNFNMCLEIFSEQEIPNENQSENSISEILTSCLLPDNYYFADSKICFPIKVKLCCGIQDPPRTPKDTPYGLDGGLKKFDPKSTIDILKIFTVNPNPAGQAITFESNFENENVTVFDSFGQLHSKFHLAMPGKHVIDVSSFTSGVYIFSKDDGEKNQIARFLKL